MFCSSNNPEKYKYHGFDTNVKCIDNKKAPYYHISLYYHIRMISEGSCVLLTPTVLKVPKLSELLY